METSFYLGYSFFPQAAEYMLEPWVRKAAQTSFAYSIYYTPSPSGAGQVLWRVRCFLAQDYQSLLNASRGGGEPFSTVTGLGRPFPLVGELQFDRIQLPAQALAGVPPGALVVPFLDRVFDDPSDTLVGDSFVSHVGLEVF